MALGRINTRYFYARLGSLRSFWRTRYGLLRVDFKRLQGIFKLRLSIDTASEETSALKVLSRNTYLPIIFAGLIAIGFYVFERNLTTVANLHLVQDSVIGRYLLNPLDKDAYVQLLTTVAAVTGVFLGLYYTAVSTVIANAYSTVPNDIRELLVRDRIGNIYVKIVSFSTALSVILLAMQAAGGQLLHLVPPLFILVSCFVVFAFVKLGQRAFFLSDLTFFSNTLSYDLSKWAKRSTYKGWRWRDSSFQEHYRKQASKVVTTLAALATISGTKPELQGDSYPRLVSKLIFTVRHYYDFKHSIPSDSRWFGKKYQHKQWYLTESTELNMASQTDTALQPNEVPDATWVEDEILDVVFEALKKDVNSNNYEALHTKLTTFPELFDDMGKHWLTEDGKVWCDKVTENVFKRLIKQNPPVTEVKPAYTIAVADICAALPLSLELGFIKAVKEIDVGKLRERMERTNWAKNTSPYKFNLPPSTIKALEQIKDGALFEKAARSPHKAPGWYVVEFAFNNLDWTLFRQWSLLIKLVETWYIERAKELTDAGFPTHAAAVYTRAIELAWKMDNHIESLKQVSEALRKGSKLDFTRPDWNWEKEHERVVSFRNLVIYEMAKLIPSLLPEPADSDIPDYFGGAVHRTGEVCYDALIEGDNEQFEALFRPYFLGILGAFDRVRPQVMEWEPPNAIVWLSEPIIDLFEISGYAYILAEFHNRPEIWRTCKEIWDTYLSQEQQQRLKFLAGISYHHQNFLMGLPPRSDLRGQKQIRLANLFTTLPRQPRTNSFSDPPVQHPSAFIRAISPRHELIMSTNAIDVFTVKYLMAQVPSSNIDFGVSQAKIDHIQRDQESNNV